MLIQIGIISVCIIFDLLSFLRNCMIDTFIPSKEQTIFHHACALIEVTGQYHRYRDSSATELIIFCVISSWWRHRMETFSALLALCEGKSPVTGEFSSQRPVTWSFDVFFHLRLNKRLRKQSRGWWFETPSHPSWRHCNDDNEYSNSECYASIVVHYWPILVYLEKN